MKQQNKTRNGSRDFARQAAEVVESKTSHPMQATNAITNSPIASTSYHRLDGSNSEPGKNRTIKLRSCFRHLAILPIGVGLLSSLPLPAPAVEVGWHDKMYLQLGDGVKLCRQKEPAAPGLVVLSNPATTNNLNTGSWVKSVSFAQDAYDMVKTLSVNSSVSLDAFVFSGEASVSFFSKQTFDANDLVFVYTGIKDFGTTVYTPQGFSPGYTSLMNSDAKSLKGASLDSAITGAVGTHYVRGYDSAAMVSVIYSFHYASTSVKQQTIASASGVTDVGSFSTFVSQFFGSTNTTASLSYQFYSTDPNQLTTNMNFGSTGVIRSFQQFTNFLSRIDSYGNAMLPAHAKITRYVLDPITTVPGYLSSIAPYIPPQIYPADYDDFFKAYAALDVVKGSLATWLLQGNTMGWLNPQGRQAMLSEWNQVGSLLAELRSVATSHFTSCGPLNVPSDVTAFLASYGEFRVPQLDLLDSFANGSDDCILGRVVCGCTNWTTSVPFFNLAAKYCQTNYYSSGNPSSVPIYYTPSDFQTAQLAAHPSGTINTHLKSLFASELWNCLTNVNPAINGYFLITQPSNEAANWTIEVDTIDAGGNAAPVDEMPFHSTRQIQSLGCTVPCTVSIPLNQ